MKAKVLFPLFFCVVALFSPVVRAGVYDVPNKIQVGAFFYTWYNGSVGSGSGSYGCNWVYPDVLDKPVVGYYNSSDASVIAQQLAWASDLKIDFFMLSWFGAGSFTDNNTKAIFAEALANVTNVKLCIFAEAYLGYSNASAYNYTAIQNYVWDTFVVPYPSIYYEIPDQYGVKKPLLCWWNEDNFTDPSLLLPNLDSRFSYRIVGHKDYVDWIYHNGVLGSYVQPSERSFTVCPRYDDTYVFGRSSGRFGTHVQDTTYSEGFYLNQWANCLGNATAGGVSYVLICSWNEYEERTEIEPHFDRSAFSSDPYYIYNITKSNILSLKGLDPVLDVAGSPWYTQPWALFMFIIGVALALGFMYKRR